MKARGRDMHSVHVINVHHKSLRGRECVLRIQTKKRKCAPQMFLPFLTYPYSFFFSAFTTSADPASTFPMVKKVAQIGEQNGIYFGASASLQPTSVALGLATGRKATRPRNTQNKKPKSNKKANNRPASRVRPSSLSQYTTKSLCGDCPTDALGSSGDGGSLLCDLPMLSLNVCTGRGAALLWVTDGQLSDWCRFLFSLVSPRWPCHRTRRGGIQRLITLRCSTACSRSCETRSTRVPTSSSWSRTVEISCPSRTSPTLYDISLHGCSGKELIGKSGSLSL